MLSHRPQPSASHHMGKEQPQLQVRTPPHHSLSLPCWWANSKLLVRPKDVTQPMASLCGRKHASHQQNREPSLHQE